MGRGLRPLLVGFRAEMPLSVPAGHWAARFVPQALGNSCWTRAVGFWGFCVRFYGYVGFFGGGFFFLFVCFLLTLLHPELVDGRGNSAAVAFSSREKFRASLPGKG